MPSQRKFTAQRGFLTFAQNSETVDYLELSRQQAASIRMYMKDWPIALVVDESTAAHLTDRDRKLFDHIITLRQNLGVFANEAQAFALTPYKETIKLESDLVLTRNISHWMPGFRHHDILMPNKIVNFRNEVVVDQTYRDFFRQNNLPNVYTGIYYFRYSATASEFFNLVCSIFRNWDTFKNHWRHSPDQASTDVVFAIAALLFGPERCTNPALSYPTMVHMKGAINGLAADADWTQHLYSQLSQTDLIVGFHKQFYPFHFYQKHWRQNYGQ
jgi:hypothetical protein